MRQIRHALSAVLALCLLFVSTALLPSSAIFSTQKEVPKHRIFMGDSRTVGMYSAIHGGYGDPVDVSTGNEYWIAKTSQGYRWMTATAIPKAEAYGIGSSTEIFILFGVNDLGNQGKYLSTINEKAAQWKDQGAKVYFVSVNPVNENKCHSVSNEQIARFNTSMRNGLSRSVTYVDTYSALYEEVTTDPETTDRLGLHYSSSVYQEIYNTLLGY